MDTTLEKMRVAKGRGQAKTDFLLHRGLITAAAEAGHSKMVIWRVLHEEGKFRASYPQFLAYMSTLLTQKSATSTGPSEQPHVGAALAALPKTAAQVSANKPAFKVDPFKPDILKAATPKGDTPAKV